jgi:hypothetical protein
MALKLLETTPDCPRFRHGVRHVGGRLRCQFVVGLQDHRSEATDLRLL